MADWDHSPDHRRVQRLGFDEAVYCAGKSADQVGRIVADAQRTGHPLLLTRLDPEKLAAVPEAQRVGIDYDPVSLTGIYGAADDPPAMARVAVVSAGTSDATVAREAVRTLGYYGENSHEIHDVGVAGLWRLLERIEEIQQMPVVIAVAGMDAALPSVLGGLVPGAVIAVPVSSGYGVAEGGHSALNAALASCAPGVVVVNIDNGYGAACAALRVLRATDANRGEGA